MCKRRRDQRGGRQGKFGSTQALATEMASYGPVSLEAGGGRAISQDDSEVSLRLADALRKMDGLIGDYSPHPGSSPLPPDPLAVSIVTQCDTLQALVMEWEERVREGGHREEARQVRDWISPETREFLASWLTGVPTGQRGVVATATESSLREESMMKELAEVKQRLRERETQLEVMTQQLQATKHNLESRETEITLLSREREVWPSAVNHIDNGGNGPGNRASTHSDTAVIAGGFQRADPQRRSLKKALSRAFSRKKSPAQPTGHQRDSAPHIINLRESAFVVKDSHQLGEWLEGVGLEMYRQLIESKVTSGDRLIAMARQQGNQDFVQIGIVNTLHCKKLRLAVEEATSLTPTPLGGLGHNWVAEWLRMVGLPGYVRTFVEARIDGHMLNVISMGDLDLLEVNDPFHLLSMRRAIQAFRLCGYDPNYLKDSAAAAKGSQRLLHWTAQDVKNWLWNINLDEYVGALDNAGLHGALLLLEPRFTSESLARLLGIQSSQVLICKHLTKSFMDLLGPVATQKKINAMQAKNFQCILPTADQGKAKGRGKPRRAKDDEDVLLCSLAEYPPVDPAQLPVRPHSSSSTPIISRHSMAT